MSRPRHPRSVVRVGVDQTPISLPLWMLDTLPDTPAFLGAILEERPHLSPITAAEYAKRVARARREGRHRQPEKAAYNLERTALNAYWRWVSRAYERRVRPVRSVLASSGKGLTLDELRTLRVGCLVPPYPGKQILRAAAPQSGDATAVMPSTAWTLHLPISSEDRYDYRQPMPTDVPPDYTTTVLELDDTELAVIAEAFYDAWGRDARPDTLAAQLPLFGEPPLTEEDADRLASPRRPRLPATALTGPESGLDEVLAQLDATMTDDADRFVERLADRAQRVLAIDLDLIRDGDALDSIQAAMREAWKARQDAATSDNAAQ